MFERSSNVVDGREREPLTLEVLEPVRSWLFRKSVRDKRDELSTIRDAGRVCRVERVRVPFRAFENRRKLFEL